MTRPKIPHVPFRQADEIHSLVARFDDCSLPCERWTHAAHLTVGLWYLRTFPANEALRRIRSGIQRYNAGCLEDGAAGYHETITRFYLWSIGRYLAARADRQDLVGLVNELVEYAARPENLPLHYYHAETLQSRQARESWVLPDRRELETY